MLETSRSKLYSVVIVIARMVCDNAQRGVTNRIYHLSAMQTEKSRPEGEQIMPETRFTEFPAFFVDPRVGISLSHQRPMIDYFS